MGPIALDDPTSASEYVSDGEEWSGFRGSMTRGEAGLPEESSTVDSERANDLAADPCGTGAYDENFTYNRVIIQFKAHWKRRFQPSVLEPPVSICTSLRPNVHRS
jgi:hypothetical protein